MLMLSWIKVSNGNTVLIRLIVPTNEEVFKRCSVFSLTVIFSYLSFCDRTYVAVMSVKRTMIWFWLKVSKSHPFTVKLGFFRHYLCSDSSLASWLFLDQSMTNACVMTRSGIYIFICDIKNSSPLPQVFLESMWNTKRADPHVPAK